MKKNFMGLFPLLILLAIGAGYLLLNIGVRYVNTTLTRINVDIVVSCQKQDTGLSFEIEYKNDGPLDIALALVRIRVNNTRDEYLWFSNWDLNRTVDIVPAHGKKTSTLTMDLPPEKYIEITKQNSLNLNITGVYDITGLGSFPYAFYKQVRIDD